MSAPDFVHLHSHTDFSMLDGAAKVEDLLLKVNELGQKAVAVTDHGYLYGLYELDHTAAVLKKKLGDSFNVKPIFGLEAYVTPGTSRHDSAKVKWGKTSELDSDDSDQSGEDVSAGGSYTHMTIWAENNEGFRNLRLMDSTASKDAVMRWPRIDKELMNKHNKGLIVSTGCPSSAVSTRLRLGQFDEALKEAGELQDIFGKENVFVEIMDHGLEFERSIRSDILKLSEKLNAPLLATNDLHYVNPEDARMHDALLCINTGSKLREPTIDEVKEMKKSGKWENFRSDYHSRYDEYPKGRFSFGGSGYYVKSAQEMSELFKDLPQALSNTLLIAERCNVSVDYMKLPKVFDGSPISNLHMPKVDLPAGETEDSYFSKLVFEGLKKRFRGQAVPKNYEDQAKYEVDMILKMGFPGYFLVVSDFIVWAKENGIFVGPGRGSAAGSIVSWALRITELDPIYHKLVFERFLNPERVSLPDIDVDFEEGGREQVIRYCADKYGEDSVAQIMTISKIKSKSAIKDSARIIGAPISVGENLVKEIPSNGMLTKISKLTDAFEAPDLKSFNGDKEKHKEALTIYNECQSFRDAVQTDTPKQSKEVYELAAKIENLTRGWGVHAAGVIISPIAIPEVVPTFRRQTDDAIVTQYDAHGCEDLGLVKMDFLGLKNLNTTKQALENIKLTTGKEIVLEEIPLDDKKTFELIGSAQTLGVFQLDGGGIRSLLKRMRPDRFEDISATIALYRPGPMGQNSHNDYADRKNGLKKIEPIHPEVEKALSEILGETYGLIVYQEQIQFAAQKLANYTLGQADSLRRAMGKKIKAELDQNYEVLAAGMQKNGYSEDAINSVWDVFVPFAEYAFNRAHSAAYGLIAYYNAYLKANYPTEYMSALLTTFENNKDKLGLYIAECSRLGIKVLVPDVNKSGVDFLPNPADETILFGLGAIRNVGEGIAEEIIKARKSKGEYTDFIDFLNKVPETVCNKMKIESLIKSGAFDSISKTRRSLLEIHLVALESVMPIKRKESAGQFDLFSSIGEDVSEISSFTFQIPEREELPLKDKLNYEKEFLGRYVSQHILEPAAKVLYNNSDFPIASLSDSAEMEEYTREEYKGYRGKTVSIAGMITKIQRRIAKSGKEYAILTIEDLSAETEVGLFGKAYKLFSDSLALEQIVVINGRIVIQGEDVHSISGKINASTVENLNISIGEAPINDVVIKMQQVKATNDNFQKLKELFLKYPGESSIKIQVLDKAKKITKVIDIPPSLKVTDNPNFKAEVLAEVPIIGFE